MRFPRATVRSSPPTLLAIAAACALTAAAALTAGSDVRPESAQQLVEQVVATEIKEQTGPALYWQYFEIDTQNGTSRLFDVYETKAGTVKRLLAVNGEPLPSAQSQKQQAALQRLWNDPGLAQRAAIARSQDGQRERRLLQMLPNAFLFQYNGRAGHLVRLSFRPNPGFDPPTHEATVFHHMQGHLLIDPGQLRLAEIDGTLISEVKFWDGLLGHLDKGGTFFVRQTDLGGGNWQMTRLIVNMNGKALFFKTIGVQENQRFEDYRENPPDITLRQAIDDLRNARIPSDLAAIRMKMGSGEMPASK